MKPRYSSREEAKDMFISSVMILMKSRRDPREVLGDIREALVNYENEIRAWNRWED